MDGRQAGRAAPRLHGAGKNLRRGEGERQANGQVLVGEPTPGETVDRGQAHAAADRQEDREAVGGGEKDRPVLVGEQVSRRAAGQSVDGQQEARETGADAAAGSEAVPAVPVGEDALAEPGDGPRQRHGGRSGSRLAPTGLPGRETDVSGSWRGLHGRVEGPRRGTR